jgi:hypothetical protein
LVFFTILPTPISQVLDIGKKGNGSSAMSINHRFCLRISRREDDKYK